MRTYKTRHELERYMWELYPKDSIGHWKARTAMLQAFFFINGDIDRENELKKKISDDIFNKLKMKNETIINDNAGVLTFTTPQTKINIKTIDITAKEWFDKVNGNSYFSACVVLNWQLPGETTFKLPFQYGYGDHYKDMVMKELLKRGIIPAHDQDAQRIALWRYCDDNKIVLRYDKHERCLKREVVAFGAE